jgi:Sec-independent protein secretion pathway component TatC
MEAKKDFETYWLENRKQILESNPEYKRIINSYKMSSGADWLLFAIPVVGAIMVMNYRPFSKELLNYLLSAVVAIVLFGLSVWVKSLITNSRPLSEVEAEIKEKCRRQYEQS